MYRWIGVLCIVVFALTLGFLGTAGSAEPPAPADPLPRVKSCAELAGLIEESLKYSDYYARSLRVGGAEIAQQSAAADAPRMKQSSANEAEYSRTNVQVAGVDEADVVKSDGRYIYQVNGSRVIVIQALPAGEMAVKKVINFADKTFTPQEIYVDSEHLVVVGMAYAYRNAAEERATLVRPRAETTRAVVFDVRDKNNIRQLREIEVEGRYLTSRKIDKNVYLVANNYPDYHLLREPIAGNVEYLTPAYRDTAAGEGYQRIECTDVCYFPDFAEPNYLLVASLNLNSGKQMELGAYLGAGENVYASRDNLYVAATKIEHRPVVPRPIPVPMAGTDASLSSSRVSAGIRPPIAVPEDKTTIYRFGLGDARLVFNGQGEVPGRVLNQFSMDEQDGYFRVAVTEDAPWGGEPSNSLFVLNRELKITGKIEDIAPGERIYAVRFMGARAYVVTFKTIDPLFAFDLSDPANPVILGALKIPGFSNYLHPYGENHLIGFGKDAVEAVQKSPDGTVLRQGFAWEQGMKIALFDVTDVSHPVEKYAVRIGDRGTHSEVLDNHKALLFDKGRGLLALPVTVAEIRHPDPSAPWAYGAFSFQGAYVYDLTLEEGFTLRGRLTHRSDEDYLKAGQDCCPSALDVKRILYIGDNLYTLSDGMVKAYDMATLTEKGTLTVP